MNRWKNSCPVELKDFSHTRPAAEREKDILNFWEEHQIFQQSVEQNRGRKPFVFFEGPPTANGKPGIHHVLSRVYKDIYIRYRSQQGYYVPRRAGWDCHGLPVEREIEKELGIKTKAQIENEIGLEKFNKLCRESVMRYIADWNEFSVRMGFWIDLENPYFTMSNEYIESVWSLLKIIWDKGLIYQGYRVVPYDTVMGSTMSDAEVALGYKTISDPSLTVRVALHDTKFGEDISFLVWTTTPWTLVSNVALAMNPAEEYVIVERKYNPDEGREGNEKLICARSLLESVMGDAEHTIIQSVKGKDLSRISVVLIYQASLA